MEKGWDQADSELYVENQSVGVVSLEELLQEGSEEEVSGWYCNTYQPTPNGANLSTPDITGQGAKYALNRMYGLWDLI